MKKMIATGLCLLVATAFMPCIAFAEGNDVDAAVDPATCAHKWVPLEDEGNYYYVDNEHHAYKDRCEKCKAVRVVEETMKYHYEEGFYGCKQIDDTYHNTTYLCVGCDAPYIVKEKHIFVHRNDAQIGIPGKEYDQCKRCAAIVNEKASPAKKPDATEITSLKQGGRSFTVKWKKKAYTGYQIRYSTKSSMASAKKLTLAKAGTVSKKVTKLKANKKYYVQVRTYKTVKGKKFYSGWCAKKSVKTKR